MDELQQKREQKAYDEFVDAVMDLADEISMKEENEDYILTDTEVNFLEKIDEFVELLDKNNN